MNTAQLLARSNYLIVNKSLIQKLGVESALFLSELCNAFSYHYAHNTLDESEGFYHTVETIEENICLSKYQQSKAINKLIEEGVVTTAYKGIPAKRYFYINQDKLSELLDMTASRKRSKNLTTVGQKTSLQYVKKLDINSNKEKNNKKEYIAEKSQEEKIQNISDDFMSELAQKYNVDVSFVQDKRDTMLDWYLENPRRNKKANWEATLRNWVRRDAPRNQKESSFSDENKKLNPPDNVLKKWASLGLGVYKGKTT